MTPSSQTQAVQAQTVSVPHGNLVIEAYLATPTGEGSFPGVVVLQEIFGVNAHIRDVTERLARAGYVAIAPNMFQRTAPGFEVGYTMDETILGRTHKDQTTASQIISDVQAAIDFLKTVPNVKPEGFGCMGFCFGGHMAYLTATLPEIKATASFYGGGIATMTPGGGEPTMTRTSEIPGILYAFFGTQDPLIPVEQIDQIEAELAKQNQGHQTFRYEAGHGFFCNRRADYNPAAAADAWEKVLYLFQTTL